MAGKKPAKPMAGQSKQPVQDPAVYGTPMMYIGMKTSPSECATCGKNTVRGIVRHKNDSFFCSAGCAKKHI